MADTKPRTRKQPPAPPEPVIEPPPEEEPEETPPADLSMPGVLGDDQDGGGPPVDWQPEDLAWKCACGEWFPKGQDLRTHCLRAGNKEPGRHKSLGQFRPLTGELVKAPAREAAKLGLTTDDKPEAKAPAAVTKATTTLSPAAATSITIVPKTLVIEFCPEFRSGMQAAIELGWMPENVTLQDFLRFCVLTVFNDRDYGLCSYVKLTQEVPDNGHGRLGVQVPSRN